MRLCYKLLKEIYCFDTKHLGQSAQIIWGKKLQTMYGNTPRFQCQHCRDCRATNYVWKYTVFDTNDSGHLQSFGLKAIPVLSRPMQASKTSAGIVSSRDPSQGRRSPRHIVKTAGITCRFIIQTGADHRTVHGCCLPAVFHFRSRMNSSAAFQDCPES